MNKRILWEKFAFDFQAKEEEYCDSYDAADRQHNLMNTPFGVFAMDDTMNPFRQFEFWRAYTNFTLTEEAGDTIEAVDGIEVFVPITRYQFIIASGKLFEIEDVKSRLEKSLCSHKCGSQIAKIKDHTTYLKVQGLRNRLEREFKYWAIYIYPDGKIAHQESNNKADIEKDVELYRDAAKITSGILIESNGN